MPEFVEFAGKKEYKCSKCKATIRYAKFFGADKKLLTVDGKAVFAGYVDGKYKSNTGWPTDPDTKQMHECPPIKDGISTAFTPESELKQTELLSPDTTGADTITTSVDEDLLDKWKSITENDDEIHEVAKFQVLKQQPDIPESVLGAAVSAKESNLNMIRLIKILAERKDE